MVKVRGFLTSLKDNSSSVGLRNQKLLVQIQAETMNSATLIISSSLLLVLAILVYPLLTTLNPQPQKPDWASTHVKTAVSTSFFVSLLPLMIFLDQGAESITTNWH